MRSYSKPIYTTKETKQLWLKQTLVPEEVQVQVLCMDPRETGTILKNKTRCTIRPGEQVQDRLYVALL